MGASAGILLNRQQRRNSAAFGVHAPDEVSRALRSNHQDINVGRRNDSFEMNAEAVREAENFSRVQIGLDVLVVEFGLGLVGSKHVDPVGALGRFIGSDNDHAVGLRLLRALAVGIETDNDFVSAVAEILGLGVPLAALA